jgi:hypothetical protein
MFACTRNEVAGDAVQQLVAAKADAIQATALRPLPYCKTEKVTTSQDGAFMRMEIGDSGYSNLRTA